MSKIARVIVCVCSGGVLSFIGFIFGLGFLAIYLIAVANISTPIENAIPPKKGPFSVANCNGEISLVITIGAEKHRIRQSS